MDATTRVVYRLSMTLCAMELLGRGLVLFPTSDAKGVSTMLLSHMKFIVPNYSYALSYTVCGDHNFLMRIAANQVLFNCNKIEGFTTSRSLREFHNYPYTHSPLSLRTN